MSHLPKQHTYSNCLLARHGERIIEALYKDSCTLYRTFSVTLVLTYIYSLSLIHDPAFVLESVSLGMFSFAVSLSLSAFFHRRLTECLFSTEVMAVLWANTIYRERWTYEHIINTLETDSTLSWYTTMRAPSRKHFLKIFREFWSERFRILRKSLRYITLLLVVIGSWMHVYTWTLSQQPPVSI